MSKFVDLSDVKDQAKGAIDFWAGLLDAAAAEGGKSYEGFREECVALIADDMPKLAQKLVDTCDVLWKYSSGKEIESCFLILCSLARNANTDEQKALAFAISRSVSSRTEADQQLKTRILASLYNFFPAHRFALLLDFMDQAEKSKDASLIIAQQARFPAWCDEWKVTPAQRRQLYYRTYDLFVALKLPRRAFDILKGALKTVESGDMEEALPWAKKAVVLALSLPDEYVLDDLASMMVVKGLEKNSKEDYALVFELLMIVVEKTVADYEEFAKSNTAFFDSNPILSKDDLLSKMRLLSLATACEGKASIPFEEAAKALGVPDNGVLLETWIIRAISQGLISGKLNQLSKTVTISGVVNRSFGPKQWEKVEVDIEVWLNSVSKTLELFDEKK